MTMNYFEMWIGRKNTYTRPRPILHSKSVADIGPLKGGGVSLDRKGGMQFGLAGAPGQMAQSLWTEIKKKLLRPSKIV